MFMLCLRLSSDEFQKLLSQLNDSLRSSDAVGDVVCGGGRLIGVGVLGVVAFLAHPVKFAQCAPVPRELCLHELAEHAVPAVATPGSQSLDASMADSDFRAASYAVTNAAAVSSVVARSRAEDRCIRAWARMARA
jgi:hypothetical protein